MLLLALVLLLTAALPCAVAEEGKPLLDVIKERGYITIATEGDWSPFTYHDESNALVGLDVEIGQEIAALLGVEARFEETSWDSILAGVDSGRFAIACNGVGYTEQRAEKYHFSVPYILTHTVLVVRDDNTAIASFEDLNGKVTANTISSTYAATAEGYGASVTGVDALADTIQLVVQGRADATLNAEVAINDYLLEHPDAKIKIVAQIEGERCCIPVRKSAETDTLVAAIDEALETLRANGRLSEISKKYFNGLDLTDISGEAE